VPIFPFGKWGKALRTSSVLKSLTISYKQYNSIAQGSLNCASSEGWSTVGKHVCDLWLH
jgi:hypothetical protein